jgi:hypothetical protein
VADNTGTPAMSNRRETNTLDPKATSGYASSGMSIFSRNIAHHMGAAGLNVTPEQPERWRTLSALIGKNKNELKKIEAKLKGNVPHAERAKLDSDCDIKRRFIAKLLAEQDDLIRRGAR